MRGEYGTQNANIIFSNGGEGSVATVYGLPMHTKLEEVDPKYAEGMANARLIAAAPEMFAALLMMTEGTHADGGQITMPRTGAVRAAFDALAKATGSAS
jgi:hypothetical protein